MYHQKGKYKERERERVLLDILEHHSRLFFRKAKHLVRPKMIADGTIFYFFLINCNYGDIKLEISHWFFCRTTYLSLHNGENAEEFSAFVNPINSYTMNNNDSSNNNNLFEHQK